MEAITDETGRKVWRFTSIDEEKEAEATAILRDRAEDTPVSSHGSVEAQKLSHHDQ